MHFDVQFGRLGMRLYAYTPDAVAQVRHFLEVIDLPSQSLPSEARWSLTIVPPEMPEADTYSSVDSAAQRASLDDIHRKWASECGELRDGSPVSGLQAVKEVVVSVVAASSGWDTVSADYGILRRSPLGLESREFLLLSACETAGIQSDIWIYRGLFLMSVWWHALYGSLYLHAAAIAGDGRGFLFLGKSGAGKSTVAAIGAGSGGKVLADDGAIVVVCGEGYSLSVMPRYPNQFSPYSHLLPSLDAVFILVKDDRDQIIPVPQRFAAQALYQSFLANNLGVLISDTQALEAAYRMACEIARNVPGYELHFRKSPDFWPLINGQLPV